MVSLGNENAAAKVGCHSSIQLSALQILNLSLKALLGAVVSPGSILGVSPAFYFEFLLTNAFCVAQVASTQNLVYGTLRVSSEPRIGLK